MYTLGTYRFWGEGVISKKEQVKGGFIQNKKKQTEGNLGVKGKIPGKGRGKAETDSKFGHEEYACKH